MNKSTDKTKTIRKYHGSFRIGLLALLLHALVIVPAFGQIDNSWQDDLEKQLDSGSTVSFLHLVGYFDDLLYLDLYLASDTADWVGFVHFPDADRQYSLEGIAKSDRIFFTEYDEEGRQTGYWTIEKQLNQYLGKWQNAERTKSFETVMYDEFWNPGYRKDFHKKISTYQGELEGRTVQFDIVRDHAKPVAMEWYDPEEKKRNIPVWECLDAFCREFKMSVENFGNVSQSPGLHGTKLTDGMVISFPDDPGQKQEVRLALLSERITRIEAKMDWSYFLIVEYPVFPEARSAAAVEYWKGRIMDSLNVQVDELYPGEDQPGGRWTDFAFAWFEILYWDDQFLSGKWVVQRSWTGQEWSIPVNYSIRDDALIDLNQQFKPDFDVDFFLSSFIQNGVKELPEYRDLLIRNKLKESAFKYHNFCRAGLLLSTGFDTFFGSFQLLVPYGEIFPYLRKRSMLRKLIEKS
jgi:hypothetical protein